LFIVAARNPLHLSLGRDEITLADKASLRRQKQFANRVGGPVHFRPLFVPLGGLDDIDHVRDKPAAALRHCLAEKVIQQGKRPWKSQNTKSP
jgi:hypothetical protein